MVNCSNYSSRRPWPWWLTRWQKMLKPPLNHQTKLIPEYSVNVLFVNTIQRNLEKTSKKVWDIEESGLSAKLNKTDGKKFFFLKKNSVFQSLSIRAKIEEFQLFAPTWIRELQRKHKYWLWVNSLGKYKQQINNAHWLKCPHPEVSSAFSLQRGLYCCTQYIN